MSQGWTVACIGFVCAGAAIVAGLLLAFFWPQKRRGRIELLLDVVHHSGLALIAVGVFIYAQELLP